MEIEVNVKAPSLQSLIEEDYDGTQTIGDKVVSELVGIAVRGDKWDNVTRRVKDIRDEEIRVAVHAEIVEALSAPITKTNAYGEKVGDETTLREVIANEAREAMRIGHRNTPWQSDIPEHARPLWNLIQKEAAAAVTQVIKQEVAEEAARIRQAMRDQAAALLADGKAK
jgi:hypothetical protein